MYLFAPFPPLEGQTVTLEGPMRQWAASGARECLGAETPRPESGENFQSVISDSLSMFCHVSLQSFKEDSCLKRQTFLNTEGSVDWHNPPGN